MEDVTRDILEALFDDFDDDCVHTNFLTTTAPISQPEELIHVQPFPAHQDENGVNHKSATNQKPGKIAAYSQKECRPWLTHTPLVIQPNSGYEAKTQNPTTLKVRKEDRAPVVFRKVMDEVANKTREAFLKHYGDDLVHVQLQQLWKAKMMSAELKQSCIDMNFPPASVATTLYDLDRPRKRRRKCGSRTSTQEKVPPPPPSQTPTSVPLPREAIQFKCLPAYGDANGTNSKSAAYMKLSKAAAYKQQQSRPWLKNAGLEKAQPIFSQQLPAKKQQLCQPWLNHNPFSNQDNVGLEEARQMSQLQPPATNFPFVSFIRNSSTFDVHADTSNLQHLNCSDIESAIQ